MLFSHYKPIYLLRQVVSASLRATVAFERVFLRTIVSGRGGTGRRAALRSLWGQPRGSSSLLDRIFSIFL